MNPGLPSPRIVSLLPAATEIVARLGLRENLVGRSHECDEPADVAAAAREYVAARRGQMQALTDRTYVPADGASVDLALDRLNQLCGIKTAGQPL